MKKQIAALLSLILFCSVFTSNASAAAERFTDVKPGAWYYTAVDYAVSEGLFSGTSADTFSPGSPMTRAMFVRVLGNKAKVDPDEYQSSSFSDVQAGVWYAPYVEWAAQNGIVTGTGNGRFSPNQSVTREQMAVILYNYAKYAVEWAVTHNILSGSGGKLDPKGTATRAQVAQIFYNSRDLLANSGEEPQPPTPSPSPDPTPDPDAPRISITDEVRAKLKPNQDPEMILDYVLHGKHDDPTFFYDGTSAQWDPALISSEDAARSYSGSWEDVEDEMNSSSVVANDFIQTLTRTASGSFYITAEKEDGCFCLYYRPADKPDSDKMRQIKTALNLTRPIRYDRGLCYRGAGWAGPFEWDTYNGAQGIARKVEYYLLEMHPYATEYYLTEPQPGVFYLLY